MQISLPLSFSLLSPSLRIIMFLVRFCVTFCKSTLVRHIMMPLCRSFSLFAYLLVLLGSRWSWGYQVKSYRQGNISFGPPRCRLILAISVVLTVSSKTRSSLLTSSWLINTPVDPISWNVNSFVYSSVFVDRLWRRQVWCHVVVHGRDRHRPSCQGGVEGEGREGKRKKRVTKDILICIRTR